MIGDIREKEQKRLNEASRSKHPQRFDNDETAAIEVVLDTESQRGGTDDREPPNLGSISSTSSVSTKHKDGTPESARRQRFRDRYKDPTNPLESRKCFHFMKTPSNYGPPAIMPPASSDRSQKSNTTRSTSENNLDPFYDIRSRRTRTPPRRRPMEHDPVVALSPFRSKGSRTSAQRGTPSTAGESYSYGSQNDFSREDHLLRNGRTTPQPKPPSTIDDSEEGPIVSPLCSPAATKAPKSPKRATQKKEEKKTENEKPPEELIISRKPDINLLRSKSLFSEISAASSFHDGMGGFSLSSKQDTDVGRMLRSLESSLEAATATGKQIDRLLVYKTLLEVSDTMSDSEERQAMQNELSQLLGRSETNRPAYEYEKEFKQNAGLLDPNDTVKKVRITTPAMGRGMGPEGVEEIPEITPPPGAMIHDDDESCESFDSDVSRDTFNFLNDFLTLGGLLGASDKPKGSSARRHKTRIGTIHEDEEDDEWSEFMEETGLSKEKKSRKSRAKAKPVSLIRTYSEETGFTNDSAFTSRYTKNSYYTDGTQSQYTDGRSQFTRDNSNENSEGSVGKSWWRQGGNGEEGDPEAPSRSSRNNMRQRMKAQKKSLKSPRDATRPREKRERVQTGMYSKPILEEGDDLSLSSIESNLYQKEDKYQVDEKKVADQIDDELWIMNAKSADPPSPLRRTQSTDHRRAVH